MSNNVTDNKVGKITDSEITIKALKQLLELVLCEGCLQRAATISHAIDLINRLQAENEQKDKNYIELLKTSSERAVIIGEQSAEIERLKNANEMFTDIGKLYSEIKAEAYKEFANWQEIKLANNPNISTVALQSIIATNDNLLKELGCNNES